ncbi:hypothetical protein [Paenibacillus guangzhouensis]|uniref:hypothetical protein n=1 Tax=Paenibacillus guangzhouensis TaxID=1473112 RepID=UPI0012669772|nr:hypothetical protein [Paenibacillus guangzhouensis]
MKRHNEKLLKMSQKLSEDTLRKSNATVERLTHLPPSILKVGYRVGATLGVILIGVGVLGLLIGSTGWGLSGVFAGAITIVSNMIAMRRSRHS